MSEIRYYMYPIICDKADENRYNLQNLGHNILKNSFCVVLTFHCLHFQLWGRITRILLLVEIQTSSDNILVPCSTYLWNLTSCHYFGRYTNIKQAALPVHSWSNIHLAWSLKINSMKVNQYCILNSTNTSSK